MKRALLLVSLPVLSGLVIAGLSCLPLVLAIKFNLLADGDNGLGLGLLAFLGFHLGLAAVLLGEALLLGLWVTSELRRKRGRAHARCAHTPAHPADSPQPPSLPDPSERAR
jgi:hypothetical protein